MTTSARAPRPADGPSPAQVAQVRAFNRFYTNVIGLLHDLYLDTPYTLTESRLLFEIARHGTVGVPALRQALDIDPGYLSRVLSRFAADGLVTRHRSAAGARRQDVNVTEAGRAAVAELDARAAAQIGALLGGVDRGPLLDAMRVITDTLSQPAPGGDGTAGRVVRCARCAAVTSAGSCSGTAPCTRPSSAGTPPSKGSARRSRPSTPSCASTSPGAPRGGSPRGGSPRGGSPRSTVSRRARSAACPTPRRPVTALVRPTLLTPALVRPALVGPALIRLALLTPAPPGSGC